MLYMRASLLTRRHAHVSFANLSSSGVMFNNWSTMTTPRELKRIVGQIECTRVYKLSLVFE